MFAGSGKYFWWAAGALVLCVVIFFYQAVAGPRLRTAAPAASIDLGTILSGIAGVLTALATLIAAIDKFGSGGKSVGTPTSAVAPPPRARPPEIDDPPVPRFRAREIDDGPPVEDYRRGGIYEFVRISRDGRDDLIDRCRFVGYDRDGNPNFEVIKKYRERRD